MQRHTVEKDNNDTKVIDSNIHAQIDCIVLFGLHCIVKHVHVKVVEKIQPIK